MIRLTAIVALHSQNLDHADEDVDEIQFKADALIDNIAADQASLGHASVVQDLLNIVEGEATEDGKTPIQPDLLRPHQGAGSSGGKDERGESRESNNGHTGKERSTEVQVFLLLGRGTDKGDRAHHSNGVQTSAGKQSGVHEHQRREKSSLGNVESRPKTVLHHIAR